MGLELKYGVGWIGINYTNAKAPLFLLFACWEFMIFVVCSLPPKINFLKKYFRIYIRVSKRLDPDHA